MGGSKYSILMRLVCASVSAADACDIMTNEMEATQRSAPSGLRKFRVFGCAMTSTHADVCSRKTKRRDSAGVSVLRAVSGSVLAGLKHRHWGKSGFQTWRLFTQRAQSRQNTSNLDCGGTVSHTSNAHKSLCCVEVYDVDCGVTSTQGGCIARTVKVPPQPDGIAAPPKTSGARQELPSHARRRAEFDEPLDREPGQSPMTYSRYRHLAIKRAKPAPTDTQLTAIETLLDAHLPASFRDFLRVANGGYLEYVIDVPMGTGKTEPLCFCYLFSADEGTFCDGTLVGEIRSAREYLKIPQGVLPFARDGGASVVYLDLSPKGNGRVVALVTGLPEWANSRTKSAFIELTSSFDEYVAKLRIDRDVVIDQVLDEPTDMSDVDAIEEWLDIGMPRWREDSELVTILCEARRSLTPSSGKG